MSDKQLAHQFLEGTKKSVDKLLKKKRALGQSVVIADEQGNIKTVLAKDVQKKTRSKKTV
ncbi:MAG: hypothetical protein ACK4GN_06160 [Runella sp.]